MNKKDLYNSLEKELNKMVEEDKNSQDLSKRLSSDKEREILKKRINKQNVFYNKKVLAIAAGFIAVLFAVPLLIQNIGMRAGANYAHPSDLAESASDEVMGETSADYYPETPEKEASGNTTEVFEINDNPDSKITYTFFYQMETTDYEKTSELMREKVKAQGGFISEMSLNSSNRDLKRASFTIRIPKENSEEFQRNLGEVATITNQNLYTEDLTKRYSDIENQVKTLEIKEARYLELLENAENMEDIITIESHLADVQGQLNYLKQDMKNIDYDVDYNTFEIDLEEVEHVSGSIGSQDNFGNKLSEAFRDSFINFLYFIQNIILFLVRNIVFILVIVLIALFVTYIIKRKKKS